MRTKFASLVCGLLLVAASARAESIGIGTDDPEIVNSEAFIRAHPDLRYRRAGAEAYARKRYGEAFGFFRDASRYADKASQAMVAEMLWNGEGTAQDRALAYAWSDLAAERSYPRLLAQRERYWSQLDAAERKRAIEVGQAIYAEYADDVAKPRMEKELARERLQITGSHLGHVGALALPGSMRVEKGLGGRPGSVGDRSFSNLTDGSLYYAANYWEPSQYWKWQDAQWRKGAEGIVVVGAPQSIGKMN